MRRAWLVPAIIAVALSGCAGLRQFPETSTNYAESLASLDTDYVAALNEYYKPGATAADRKNIRNRLVETRMAVIDANFQTFRAGLVKENVGAEFAIALAGIGVGAAGSLVAQTASQILSAVSGGLAGAQAAYSKAVLYDKAMAALLAQMQASRKAVKTQILERWDLDVDKYPLWMARADVDAYYFAGSLPGAIIGTAADAGRKEREADDKLAVIQLRTITPEAASPEMRLRRLNLKNAISGLPVAAAKRLVKEVQGQSDALKNFLAGQYPADIEKTDTDGSTAKTALRRAVEDFVISGADADRWQDAINAVSSQ